MSQQETLIHQETPTTKSLWPVMAVILGVVFIPALLAWAINVIRP